MSAAAAERSPTPTGSPVESEACDKGRGAFHLDLDNFDGDDVPDDCPYVLTSPRSLEACKRLRVQVSRVIDLSRTDLEEIFCTPLKATSQSQRCMNFSRRLNRLMRKWRDVTAG